MKNVDLTIPQLAIIAGTRGLLGSGIALLLAERIPQPRRRAIGWTLLAIGALSTIPLVAKVRSRIRES
jgi:hypothetical protein